MTYLPGGAPKIPNQLPTPYGTPSAVPTASEPPRVVTTAERQAAMTKTFLKTTIITGILLGGAVLVAFVMPGLDEPLNIIVVMGAAAISAAITSVMVLRQVRRNGASVRLDSASGPVIQDAALTQDVMPFHLTVEDVFSITGRGTVATGKVASGTLSPGQTVSLVRAGSVLRQTRVIAIEAFRRQVEVAQPGENIGLVLEGLSREDVQPGDVLAG